VAQYSSIGLPATIPDFGVFVGSFIPVATPTPAPTPVPSVTSVGVLVPTSTAALAQMFFNANPNTPTNIQISLNLTDSSRSAVISYLESTSGQTVEAAFGTINPTGGAAGNTEYNGWVNQSGTEIWKGFFQDQFGAIVLIVDSIQSQVNGQPVLAGGSVWFQNFNQAPPNNPVQGPLKMCWEITAGPYDCRTFLLANYQVDMTSSNYPLTGNIGPNASMSYVELGTFAGVNLTTAGFSDAPIPALSIGSGTGPGTDGISLTAASGNSARF
jgi:hypothetical protein